MSFLHYFFFALLYVTSALFCGCRKRQDVILLDGTQVAGVHAFVAFELDIGRLPSDSEGWEILLKKPIDPSVSDLWRGPYLNSHPLDEQGQPLLYRRLSDGMKFEIRALGRDGVLSDDDEYVVITIRREGRGVRRGVIISERHKPTRVNDTSQPKHGEDQRAN
jgi:hypothetical protein